MRHALCSALILIVSAPAFGEETRLLRHPTVSRDSSPFPVRRRPLGRAAGGGQARRLTATPNVETEPHFSPDGSRIAFTAVGGNTDVYVMPTAGGDPTRLTFHPGSGPRPRVDAGWKPRVLFLPRRESAAHRGLVVLSGVLHRARRRAPRTAPHAPRVHGRLLG